MKHLGAVFLMTESAGEKVRDLALQAGLKLDALIANDSYALERAFSIPHDLLLSFGTGVIVPSRILEMPSLLALNVHAAPPQYPGRDPHHFAAYDGAKQYGATLHYMTQSVDAGPIVDVELFDVPGQLTPAELLAHANDAGWLLIERFFRRFAERGAPEPMHGQTWGPRKTTRRMFKELCRIDPDMRREEFERRLRAAAMPGYRNLYLEIHGYRFKIEDSLQ